MEIVVNEWLPDWLAPNPSSPDSFKKANLFLKKFYEKTDVLVVKYHSPLTAKIMQYSKRFSGYPDNAKILGFVNNKILLDSKKCKLLYNEEIQPLPELLEKLLHTPFDSDKYLFEAANSSADKIVVTTDKRLIEQTASNGIIQVIHFDDFMKTY